MRRVVVASLLVIALLAGCASKDKKDNDSDVEEPRTTGLTAFERVLLPFDVSGDWSKTIVPGEYGILLPGTSHFVDVPLPITELGAAVFDPEGPRAHLGLFLPDIPGCDWEAAPEVNPACQIPVIADVGPYYRTSTSMLNQPEGDTVATEPANRLGRFLIENFVPHGYAVAQVSVMGSGDSNHCFDMFGMAEQMGVDAAVTWLGTQWWSNGNVSLIGRSYDGSTPWQAATWGNPHVKTIVPISGLHGLQALVTHNGSSESRVATFHNVIYGQFGIDGDAGDIHHVCPDWLTAVPMGAGAAVTGDQVIPTDDSYWAEREFLPRVLANYQGSVYFIHGLQDWNVDPHLISPAFQDLREAGIEVKGLFGQWGHMYPDRPGEHENLPEMMGAYPWSVRYDWAEDLKEWFDYYLKGEGLPPVLKVEVQDNIGRWRVEETYPPTDEAYIEMPIPGAAVTLGPTGAGAAYDLGPVPGNGSTLLSGHMYLEASVTPSGANGQIYFEVTDADTGERLAFGVMDLRYRGSELPITTPGETIEVRVQSQPFEFVVPAGHRLRLAVEQAGGDYLPAPSAGPMEFDPSASRLLLPSVVRGADAFFVPPLWSGTQNETVPAA